MTPNPEFDSPRSYRLFADSITREWRYSRSEEQLKFLEAVLATSESRAETMQAYEYLSRAQIAFDWQPIDVGGGEVEEVPAPCGSTRMKPRMNMAFEGRANPKGMSVLYMATHRETAIAEVRPWVGLYVTVATLRTKRALRIVNCTNDEASYIRQPFKTPKVEEYETIVWADINRAFSAPVNPNDEVADYVPTQVLAEYFRRHGFDGVAYASALGPGHNIALFDLDAADVRTCDLVQVTKVSFTAEQASNAYFIADPDEHDRGEFIDTDEARMRGRPPDEASRSLGDDHSA